MYEEPVFCCSDEILGAKFTSTSTGPTLGAALTMRSRAVPVVPGRLLSDSPNALCAPGKPVTTIDASVAASNDRCRLAIRAPGAVVVSNVIVCEPLGSTPYPEAFA